MTVDSSADEKEAAEAGRGGRERGQDNVDIGSESDRSSIWGDVAAEEGGGGARKKAGSKNIIG